MSEVFDKHNNISLIIIGTGTPEELRKQITIHDIILKIDQYILREN